MANFGDRYELTERIGSGGTGEVWLALDERLGGRPVAIKIMHRHVRPASGDDGRFEHELRRAAQLDHPNIVDIYATGTYRDASFLVMEYLEGHDLDMALPGDEPGRVAAVGRDICGALAYAHGQGVIHGGIKPGNAVLRGTGRVKVTDFGLAQAVRASAPGSSAPPDGMLAYLSPEQWRGEAPAFSDDVWSAGCILYRLVSGRLPRVLPGAAEYTAAARRGDPVPDLRRVSAAPDWLAGAVMAMLDPDAARRVTADECIRLLSGPPSPATALTRPAPGWLLPGQYGSGDPGTGRLPVTAAAAAGGGRGRGRVISAVAVAVLLLVAGSVAAWQLSSASRTSPPTLSRAVTTSPTAPASGQAPVPSVSRSGSAAADSPRGTSASPARSLPASPPGPRPAPASGSRSARPAPSGSSPAPRPAPPSGAPPGSPAPLPSGPPGTSGSAPPPGGPPPGGPPPGGGPPPTGGPPPGGGPPPTGGPPGGPPPGGPPPNAADTAA